MVPAVCYFIFIKTRVENNGIIHVYDLKTYAIRAFTYYQKKKKKNCVLYHKSIPQMYARAILSYLKKIKGESLFLKNEKGCNLLLHI